MGETIEMTSGPGGIPKHLHNCVIGAREHRKEGQGALYFRNTFSDIALHLIIRYDGTWIQYPGPEELLQPHDRIFMVCKIVGDRIGQMNPLALRADDTLETLLVEEHFKNHVNKINMQRNPDMQVLLPESEGGSVL